MEVANKHFTQWQVFISRHYRQVHLILEVIILLFGQSVTFLSFFKGEKNLILNFTLPVLQYLQEKFTYNTLLIRKIIKTLNISYSKKKKTYIQYLLIFIFFVLLIL